MPKRTAGLEWASENDGAREPPPRKRTARACCTPKPYRASIKELVETGTISGSSTYGLDDGIIRRIKKCLDRANHPNTAEAEAKAAFHLASRLMGQHNVS
jgi:hypothetical protein